MLFAVLLPFFGVVSLVGLPFGDLEELLGLLQLPGFMLAILEVGVVLLDDIQTVQVMLDLNLLP